MKKIKIFILILTITIVTFFVFKKFELNEQNGFSDLSDLITVEKPKINETVASPLLITGEARGYWFFEASFPIRIYDAGGKELGVAIAQAGGEWMTENFVPFASILEFEKSSTKTGVLVLEKDNPSGLSENAEELRLPIRFD